MRSIKYFVLYSFFFSTLVALCGVIASFPQVEGFAPRFGLGTAFFLLLFLLVTTIFDIASREDDEDEDYDETD